MSLETVLQIGKVLRKAPNSLKYFEYVKPFPKDKDGNLIPITIPVNDDFSFNWNGVKITPENEREELYYLQFKTSGADAFVKYIYGDIHYSRTSKIKKDRAIDFAEGGYYRLANPNHTQAGFRPSSFNRGNADYQSILANSNTQNVLYAFRESLKENLKFVELLLRYTPVVVDYMANNAHDDFFNAINNEQELYDSLVLKNYNQYGKKLNLKEFSELDEIDRKRLFDLSNYSVFIHFEFPKKKHWYQFSEALELVTKKILSEFVENGQSGQVLKKMLYKTLCSGDAKNDVQFPMFTNFNKHKARSFSNDELLSLFYAVGYAGKGKLITGTDIKLIVLPRGINLAVEDYELFLEKRDEDRIVATNSSENRDDYLFNFASDNNRNITSFDLIFSKKGGLSSPDSDLIEISGIEKSKLRLVMERINKFAREIGKERKEFIRTEKDLFFFRIDYSFRSILGNPQYDEKQKKVSFVANPKYQSHLLKVLPLIYTEKYHYDNVLLPAFIQNVEFSARAGDSKYSFLKYDLKFLLSIQNNNSKNNKFMEITASESYQIGLMLGGMAKSLSLEINSFEKNYVGNITRRIGTLSDFIKLKNEIEQKLIMHDKSKFTFQTSYELAQKIKDFRFRYDKEECAFGFMEGYFKPLPSKKSDSIDPAEVSNNK